jgi:uncharacterized protein YegP (UPF0339 family)
VVDGRLRGREAGPHRRVSTAAKFEVYEDKAGESRFRLEAGNGEIIANSEGYTTKASCLKGIESVKTNAASAVVDDKTV